MTPQGEIPAGQTARLILRPISISDAAQIQELFPHWEIVRYLRNVIPWPYPTDGALQFIRNFALPAIARGDEWIWTLRLKSEPERVIGVINLRRGPHDNRGFWLGLAWQGQGLMSEACAWANDFWFETLGFTVLRVAKARDNVTSRRISERQGMRLVGVEERGYVCGRLPSEIWEITADEWRAWKAHRAKESA
jgi:RimJ/RimL family protein N-acetyltransferase